MEKVVFHVDVNSAFLSWEAVFRLKRFAATLDLREIPSAVGGDMQMRRGIILAKSGPAGKRFNIKTGETILEAKRKCPDLYLVPPNYGVYEKASKAFIGVLKEYTPDVEQYSIDEAFMGMTGSEWIFGSPVEAAEKVRRQMEEELGFTVNIGVSSNKLLAKMASEFEKPNKVHTLFPNEMEEKMWPLPVSELFFVGRATAKKLFSLGIKTIGELAHTDPGMLRVHFKKQGEIIWGFANGVDMGEVVSEPPPNKGYGNSTTLPFDVTDADMAKMALLGLAETVAARLREADVKAEVVAVGIKDWRLHYVSHQCVLEEATDITWEIHKEACRLFDELWDGSPIRHLGIHTSRMRSREYERQINLFDEMDYEKLTQLDKTIDAIRRKYGIDSVKRAVFLENPIDHMSGGISREKRNVDYSKLPID